MSIKIIKGTVDDDYIDHGLLSVNEYIEGLGGNDYILGGAGNDTLDGGSGSNHLDGGRGNDTYIISGDEFLEEAYSKEEGGGIDTVISSYDGYTLFENLDNLTLVGDALTGNGNSANNVLTGNAGNNTLNGGEGADTLIGGLGNDTYIVEITESGDSIENYKITSPDRGIEIPSGGNDTVHIVGSLQGVADIDPQFPTHVQLALSANMENIDISELSVGQPNILIILQGNTSANIITGNDGTKMFDGLAGADTLIGGIGSDIYTVDIFKSDNHIVLQDTIIDADGFDFLRLRGAIQFNTVFNVDLADYIGFEGMDVSRTSATKFNLIGTDGQNGLVGNLAANYIDAKSGDDTLDGMGGHDTLVGGLGDDQYVVHVGDVVVEDVDAGIDSISSSFTYSLNTSGSANIENLTLTGKLAIDATGNVLDNTLNGNVANNVLIGGGGGDSIDGDAGNDSISGGAGVDSLAGGLGHDTLDGGDGIDYMSGGDGDDTYYIDNEFEQVYEVESEGTDTLKASITVTLSAYLNVENIVLLGTDNLDASGDANNNVLTGNVADNLLKGGDGQDTLKGGLGNDTLEGEDGKDVLYGGKGNDRYEMNLLIDDNSASIFMEDTLVEAANEGIDTIHLHGDFSFVETTSTISLGNNVENLDASDTNQTLLNIIGNGLNNYLIGNNMPLGKLMGGAGNDTLSGELGEIVEIGGTGNDVYIVSQERLDAKSHDSFVFESANAGVDTVIIQNGDGDLAHFLNIENLSVRGPSAVGIGNKFANYLSGNHDTARLEGRAGNDTLDASEGGVDLFGGVGNDTYILGDDQGTVNELANEGTDTIQTYFNASLTNTAYANIENISLLGTLALTAQGNDGNNVVTGNVAANTLTGGAGADTLIGGAGDDVYHVNLSQLGSNPLTATLKIEDTVTELAKQGVDQIVLDNSLVLKTVSTVTLVANVENLDASATGLTKLNFTGNALDNQIIANDFQNKLDGGVGNDTIGGGFANDTILGGDGNDVLNGNEDNDSLDGGNGTDSLFGGAGADALLGNLGNDSLSGDADNDTMQGGAGNDALDGGVGDDFLNGGVGIDILSGAAGADRFVFNTALSATSNVDTVMDFTSGEDQVMLSHAVFTALGVGALSPDQFHAGTGLPNGLDANDRIYYDTNTGSLYYDADGSGKSAAVKFAVLENHPADLNANDFLISAS